MSKLPSLPPVHSTSPSLDNWIKAVTEHLEVLEGRRGDPTYHAVTKAVFDANTGQLRASVNQALNRSAEEFARTLQQTAAFKELKAQIGQYDALSASVRETIRQMVNEMSSKLGADIASKQIIQQDAINSLAIKLDSVQSGLGDSLASVRELSVASSDYLGSVAAKVTTVEAEIGSVTFDDEGNILGNGEYPYVSLEALKTAVPIGVTGKYYRVKDAANPDVNPNVLYRWSTSAADYIFATVVKAGGQQKIEALVDRTGKAEASYSVKLNANGHVAGFGLSTSSSGSSAFVVQADKFAVVSSGDSGNGVTPFSVDGNTVYINGLLRVGSSTGPVANDLVTVGAQRVTLTSTSLYYKYNYIGTVLNSTVTITATLSGSLTGYVDWAGSGYSGSLPANGTANTFSPDVSYVSGEYATFTASITSGGVTYTDTITISKLRDGTQGPQGTTVVGPRGATSTNGAAFGAYCKDPQNPTLFMWHDFVANYVVARSLGNYIGTEIPDGITSDGQLPIAGSYYNVMGDVVTLTGPTSSSTQGAMTKAWTGAAWVQVAQIIDGSLLVQGTVIADSVRTGSIVADSIQAGEITYGKLSTTSPPVDTTNIVAGAVTTYIRRVRRYDFGMPNTAQCSIFSAEQTDARPAYGAEYVYTTLTACANAGKVTITSSSTKDVLLYMTFNITTSGCTAAGSNVLEYYVRVKWPEQSWASWVETTRVGGNYPADPLDKNWAEGSANLPTDGTEYGTLVVPITVKPGENEVLAFYSRSDITGTFTIHNTSNVVFLDFKR